MRLTKKVCNYYDSASDEWHRMKGKKIDLNYVFNLEQKLGQLEDIEEELDIDLITLFKVAKASRIYIKWQSRTLEWVAGTFRVDIKKNILRFSKDFGTYYKFADYGKTWALTKGELE